MGRENEASKDISIYYISTTCLPGSGTISIYAERLQISDVHEKQNKSI